MSTFTRKAISTAATIAVASTALFFGTTAAQAAPVNTNHTEITRSNYHAFKAQRAPYFSISVKASACRDCAGIPGRAALKID